MRYLHHQTNYFTFLLINSFLLFFSARFYAQKNAPVAGDAALLNDLLKKDYNTLEPDVRREQLAKDRTIVIGTLKRYLTEEEQKKLNDATENLQSEADTDFFEFKTKQQELSSYTSKTYKEPADQKTISNLTNTIENRKQEYYTKLYTIDEKKLTQLFEVYKTSNQYLAFVTSEFKAKYQRINKSGEDSFAEAMQETSIQKALPFIGGDLGFEVIIDGLSKFLAERIKEEMTAAVIEKVQDYLRNPGSNDPLAELKILLPRTQEYLLSFRASQMVNFPDEIKQYIEDDLQHLPEQLGKLGQTPRVRRLIAQNPELDFALEALELIPNLSKIKNPVDLFDLLENSRNISRWANDSTKTTQYNLANTIKFSSLLAHSLTVIDNGEMRMAGSDFLTAYGSEVPFHLLYFGFLHQQNVKYYDVRFAAGEKLTFLVNNESNENLKTLPLEYLLSSMVNVYHDVDSTKITDQQIKTAISNRMDNTRSTMALFEEIFTTIGAKAEKVYTTTQLIKKARKSGTAIGADTISAFVNEMIDLVEGVTYGVDTLNQFFFNQLDSQNCKDNVCINTKSHPIEYKFCFIENTKNDFPKNLELHKKVDPYLTIARKTNAIVYDLQQKDYATALIKALELTTDLNPNSKLSRVVDPFKSALAFFPEIDGIRRLDIKDTLDKIWKAKEWHEIITEITSSKSGILIKNKKKIAQVLLSEIDRLEQYIKDNFIQLDDNTRTNLTLLRTEIDLISHEKASSDELETVKNFLKNNEFKLLIISFYTDTYIKDWLDNVTNIINTCGKYTPQESTKIIKGFQDYKDALFDYLVTRNRENFNKAGRDFLLMIENHSKRFSSEPIFQLSESTIKVIHFINDMAKAENSDDVKNAIDAIALPAGSYSIKREQRYSLTLNSYPGFLASREVNKIEENSVVSYSTSLTAPVGLNFALGTKQGYSWSIFLPIIDVGALTRMHLADKDYTILTGDTTTQIATLPELNFINVFSPGIYLACGLRKTPISIYAGYQFGPYLREIKKEEGDVKTVSNIKTTRFSIGLTLDIPLWNISSRSRL